MRIKLGTRKSNLAVAQAEIVASKIKEIKPDCEVEICKFMTSGDRLYNANLALIGGKGLFVKEIEEALLNNEIDIAVHSMKDMPAYLPEGLVIECVLEREEVNDAFLSLRYNNLEHLPKGAVVGTSSARRRLQLLAMRPDLTIIPFRGNINTRLAKLANGGVDAIVLAYVGLKRLGLENQIKQVFTMEEMLPAVAQGAIGVESRVNDKEINLILQQINHTESKMCINVERAFMIEVSGNCTTPMAAYASVKKDGDIEFKAGFAPDNSLEIKYLSVISRYEEIFNKVKEIAAAIKEYV